jgi:dTDP-4-dehydrorhamnose 3,5-epimerase
MAIKSKIETTEIKGVLIISRDTFEDDRGFFRETFRLNDLEEALQQKFNIVQQNHSRSVKGTLRGIHIAPWNKLVYCVSGSVQEVIVDLRVGSASFGKHISINIGEDQKFAVFIPKGCGNAFQVTSDRTDYTYLTDDYWEAGKELAIAWDDPDLKIDWQIKSPKLSEKDKQNLTLKEYLKND